MAGRGVVVKWERLRRQNHWFDALYIACAAGHLCGVRLVGEGVAATPRPAPHRSIRPITLSDGQPWLPIGQMREVYERMTR